MLLFYGKKSCNAETFADDDCCNNLYIYISVIFIIISYYLLFYEKKLPMLKLLQMMIVGIIYLYIYISVIFIIIAYYLIFYEKKLTMLKLLQMMIVGIIYLYIYIFQLYLLLSHITSFFMRKSLQCSNFCWWWLLESLIYIILYFSYNYYYRILPHFLWEKAYNVHTFVDDDCWNLWFLCLSYIYFDEILFYARRVHWMIRFLIVFSNECFFSCSLFYIHTLWNGI